MISTNTETATAIPLALRHIGNIPEELQNEVCWVLWRSVIRSGKTTKVPWSVHDQPASSTDPTTWSEFSDTVMRYRDGYHAGIGFVFAKDGPFCGVDLDGCRNPKTGKIDQWAIPWIEGLDSYTEVSPSGTGIKVFCRSSLNLKGINRKIDQPNLHGKQPGIEVYTSGRYFAVTGQVVV